MIKSEMTYTKKAFDDFATYNIKKSKAMKVIYICSAIILACSLVMFVTKDYTEAILYLFLGLIFAFYNLVIKLIMNQNNKKNIGSTDVYEFDDDKLNVYSHDVNGNEIATSSLMYNRFYKVETYLNYGYIYVNKAVAYIVDKQNFESEEEFNSVLARISNAINSSKLKGDAQVVMGSRDVTPATEEPFVEVGDPVPPVEIEKAPEEEISEIMTNETTLAPDVASERIILNGQISALEDLDEEPISAEANNDAAGETTLEETAENVENTENADNIDNVEDVEKAISDEAVDVEQNENNNLDPQNELANDKQENLEANNEGLQIEEPLMNAEDLEDSLTEIPEEKAENLEGLEEIDPATIKANKPDDENDTNDSGSDDTNLGDTDAEQADTINEDLDIGDLPEDINAQPTQENMMTDLENYSSLDHGHPFLKTQSEIENSQVIENFSTAQTGESEYEEKVEENTTNIIEENKQPAEEPAILSNIVPIDKNDILDEDVPFAPANTENIQDLQPIQEEIVEEQPNIPDLNEDVKTNNEEVSAPVVSDLEVNKEAESVKTSSENVSNEKQTKTRKPRAKSKTKSTTKTGTTKKKTTTKKSTAKKTTAKKTTKTKAVTTQPTEVTKPIQISEVEVPAPSAEPTLNTPAQLVETAQINEVNAPAQLVEPTQTQPVIAVQPVVSTQPVNLPETNNATQPVQVSEVDNSVVTNEQNKTNESTLTNTTTENNN